MRFLTGALLWMLTTTATATDVLRIGGGAGSIASANILGLSVDALTALSGNPALLGRVGDGSQLSLTSITVDSEFSSKLGERARADRGPGLLPEFAMARQLAGTGWSWGAGFTIQSAMRAEFEFVDPAGTLGVSYGKQTHRSEFVIAKIGGVVSYAVSERLSLGLGLALAYNRNQLEAPYIFQTQPVLQDLKVLVDLDTDDVALTSTLGLDYAISADWRFNLAYTLQTDFSADGDLDGNLAQLGLGIQEDFSYDVNVKTALPASLVAGLSWQASDRLQLGFQYDWINWSDSFRQLPIRLTQGSNGELNAFLGQDSLLDTAPLNWKDQHVVHIGANLVLQTGQNLRLGYERGNIVVPRATATPMTGAILESAWSAGLNFTVGDKTLDLAYRLSDSSGLRIPVSGLRAGEYSGTQQSLRLHSLGLTLSF